MEVLRSLSLVHHGQLFSGLWIIFWTGHAGKGWPGVEATGKGVLLARATMDTPVSKLCLI